MDESKLIKKRSAGFTLLEMIVAISILISGVLVVYASSAQLLAYTYSNQYRLVASYLAQEGVEVVRNIRDENWINGEEDWREGLAIGSWQAQYNSNTLSVYSGSPLQLTPEGFYNYGTGEETIFTRELTITHPSDNSIKLMVEVSWPYDKGNPVQVETFLYNWF